MKRAVIAILVLFSTLLSLEGYAQKLETDAESLRDSHALLSTMRGAEGGRAGGNPAGSGDITYVLFSDGSEFCLNEIDRKRDAALSEYVRDFTFALSSLSIEDIQIVEEHQSKQSRVSVLLDFEDPVGAMAGAVSLRVETILMNEGVPL